MLLQWHIKDPSHFAKSAGGRLHLNTHMPLTHWSWSGLTVPLSRLSVGTYQKWAHTQLIRGTLILAFRVELVCATWSPLFKKKREREKSTGEEWLVKNSPKLFTGKKKVITTTTTGMIARFGPLTLTLQRLSLNTTGNVQEMGLTPRAEWEPGLNWNIVGLQLKTTQNAQRGVKVQGSPVFFVFF